MEPSPLTQVSRPEAFQPKIVQLYENLFRGSGSDDDINNGSTDTGINNDGTGLSEGFWQEFFLLRPDSAGLRRVLASMGPDDLLHMQAHSQQLFRRAVARVKQATAPSDEAALETLTVFLDAALGKKFTNPSSDTLLVLAGLHDADTVVSDFVATVDAVIRNGRTCT